MVVRGMIKQQYDAFIPGERTQAMTPKLYIIIPCYNVEQYLPSTLASLSNLKHAENCEFILINDGSTDETRNSL